MKNCFVLFFGFFLLLIVSSNAGTKLDFKTVDMLTYRCFEEGKWDSVIMVGKQALHQDIDYYYLRVRLGIAYFEKQEYIRATIHLRKAREFNSGDPVITDYLYRSYLYSNLNDEAQLLKGDIPKDKKNTKKTISQVVEQIHFEGGCIMSSDKSSFNLPDLSGKYKVSGNNDYYNEQDLYGNSFYGNLGLKIRIFKRVGLSLAYNYLSLDKSGHIQDGHFQDRFMGTTDSSGGKVYRYSFLWVRHDTSFHYNVTQHEAQFAVTVVLPAGFKIQPAFHLIHVSYTMTNVSFRTNTRQDTAFYSSINNIYRTFPFTHYNYSFNQKDTSFYNYVISLLVTKDIKIFNIGLSMSWSNLNNQTQKQAGVALTYYPLGNLNLYGTTAVTGFFQGDESRILLNQILGTKVTNWWWLEGNCYWGNYTNANIFNGSIVYNNSDKMDYRAGATMTFIASKHFQLSLIYQYSMEESQQLLTLKRPAPVIIGKFNEQTQIKNIPYYTNNIIGEITWKL